MTDDLGTQILASVNTMRDDLNHHMREEGREIQAIKTDLIDWRMAAEKRHSELIQSLESWTAKVDCSHAFIHVDGKPDLAGHKDDHLTRLQFDEWTRKVKQEVALNVAKVGSAGVLTWLLYVVWEAFLKGPHK